jgi:antitoxin Phd
MTWPVADAKARLSELLDAAEKQGPQTISRRGIETAVVVPIAEWKRLKASANRNLIDPLTDPTGPRDLEIPPRRRFSVRPAKLS